MLLCACVYFNSTFISCEQQISLVLVGSSLLLSLSFSCTFRPSFNCYFVWFYFIYYYFLCLLRRRHNSKCLHSHSHPYNSVWDVSHCVCVSVLCVLFVPKSQSLVFITMLLSFMNYRLIIFIWLSFSVENYSLVKKEEWWCLCMPSVIVARPFLPLERKKTRAHCAVLPSD